MNFYSIFAAAFASLLIGFVYYNPKVLGNIWMRKSKIPFEPNNKPNMIKMLSLHFICAFFIAFMLQFLIIHQTGAMGMIGGDPSKALPSYITFMNDYGTAFRTFKHGALHGTMVGVLLIVPLFGITALYEGRGFKYVMVASGYWVISCAVMGAIICGWV